MNSKKIGRNPIVTSIYTADPSAHVWADGRLYVYASHDMDPPQGCDFMDRYHVFSTEDMVNWRDEGEILRSDDVEWGRPEGGFMWAPDCAYRNGTYYFYYPHPSDSHWNDTFKVGVATSDNPLKGFVDQGYIEGLGGWCMIDPCVFIDDDDRVYMYYGGGGMPKGGEMNADMMTMKTEMFDMEGLVDFHEASWVFKRNGIYYMTYSDNHEENGRGANRLCYAMSGSPLGPWEYKGVYLEPTGCDTSHGSVVEYKGQWYAFYHNQAISDRGNLRSMCVDKLEFNADGTIQTVVQTSTGLLPVGPAPAKNPLAVSYKASDCLLDKGARLEENAAGQPVIAGLEAEGAFFRLTKVDGRSGGRYNIAVQYAAAEKYQKLRLSVNDEDLSFVNTVPTGGLEDFSGWCDFTCRFKPGHTNTVRLTGGNGDVRVCGIVITPLDENA